jgi:hypothetical protein
VIRRNKISMQTIKRLPQIMMKGAWVPARGRRRTQKKLTIS